MSGQNALMNAAAAYTGVKIQKLIGKKILHSDNTSDEIKRQFKGSKASGLEKEDALRCRLCS